MHDVVRPVTQVVPVVASLKTVATIRHKPHLFPHHDRPIHRAIHDTRRTMPSLTDSLANFVTAVTGIFTSLLASVFSVFQAVLALVQNLVTTVVGLATSLLSLGIDLCQGVIGFAFGAFSRLCGCGAS
jgi:hypothetical protein